MAKMAGDAPPCNAKPNALRICGCRTLRFLKGAALDLEVSPYFSQGIAPEVRQILAPPAEAGGKRKLKNNPAARSAALLPNVYSTEGLD